VRSLDKTVCFLLNTNCCRLGIDNKI